MNRKNWKRWLETDEENAEKSWWMASAWSGEMEWWGVHVEGQCVQD